MRLHMVQHKRDFSLTLVDAAAVKERSYHTSVLPNVGQGVQHEAVRARQLRRLPGTSTASLGILL